MPLYLTERISEFDVIQNPEATFVYFDSVKGDNVSNHSLQIKNSENIKGIAIIYTKNMSSTGGWTEDEFYMGGKKDLSRGFDTIKTSLIKNELVVFPIRAYSVIRSTLEDWVEEEMDKRFFEISNTNKENKELFSYYAL